MTLISQLEGHRSNKLEKTTAREKVFTFIAMNPNCTDRQIAYNLYMEKSSVIARRNELRKQGRIKLAGYVKQAGKVKNATWEVGKENVITRKEEWVRKAIEIIAHELNPTVEQLDNINSKLSNI